MSQQEEKQHASLEEHRVRETPHRIRGERFAPLVVGVVVVMAVAFVVLVIRNGPPPLPMVAFVKGVSASHVLSKCGPATADTSSASEIPRPAIVTRQLLYEPEHVRFAFVNGAGFGKVPTDDWRLIGALDAASGSALPLEDAASRLRRRCYR